MTAATEQARPVGWRPFRRVAVVDRAFDPVRSYLSAAPARLLGEGSTAPAGGDGVRTGLHVRRAGLDMSRDARVVLGDLRQQSTAPKQQWGGPGRRVFLRLEDAARPEGEA